MKLLYIENATWEYDFIVNDILSDVSNLEIEMYNQNNFHLLLSRSDIINNNILVVNIVFNIHDIIHVVKHIKPVIIFYLSDEHGHNPEMIFLQNYTKLLIRQYNHKKYNYFGNNLHLLLGYIKGYTEDKKSSIIKTKSLQEREYNCSFIGALKSDRLHMSNVFQQNMTKTNIKFVNNNWNLSELPYSPKDCFDIYNNSIFVICGRGNSNLDCFRIYEAVVAGAIPIIIGPIEEVMCTFNYNNDVPPFIFGDTWENIVEACNMLLKDYNKLEYIRNKIQYWYQKQILNMKEKINEALLISN